jgi:tetratricopeptide (TPR) repeat protein
MPRKLKRTLLLSKSCLYLLFAVSLLLAPLASAKIKQSPETHLAMGDQFRQNGRYRDAIKEYTKALKSKNQNAKVYQYRGECQLALANYKQAIKDLSKAIKLDKTDPNGFAMRARAYNAMQNYDKEKRDLDQLIGIEPKGSNMLLRAQAKMHLKDYNSALDDCNVAINTGLSRQELTMLYRIRAEAYKKLGKKDESKQEIAKFNSLEP